MPKTETNAGPLFKVLHEGGVPLCGGKGIWKLPQNSGKGEWMPKVPVKPCFSGYHLTNAANLVHWVKLASHAASVWQNVVVWIAEGAGKFQRSQEKIVFQRARLIRRIPFWSILRESALDTAISYFKRAKVITRNGHITGEFIIDFLIHEATLASNDLSRDLTRAETAIDCVLERNSLDLDSHVGLGYRFIELAIYFHKMECLIQDNTFRRIFRKRLNEVVKGV